MNKKDVILPVVLILVAILLVGGFIVLKKHKDTVNPTPAPVAVVEEVEEEPVEEPAPQPRRRQRRDINSSISSMMPVQNNQVQGMPTRIAGSPFPNCDHIILVHPRLSELCLVQP